MIGRALVSAALLASAVGLPATGQTPSAAAQGHARQAIAVCLDNYRTMEWIGPVLTAAGYTHEPEVWSAEEVYDWYLAPGNSVRVLVLSEPGSGECRLILEGVSIAAALALAEETVTAVVPVPVVQGSPEGRIVRPGDPAAANGDCTGFHLYLPQRLVWVQATGPGNDPVCVDSGGVSVLRLVM